MTIFLSSCIIVLTATAQIFLKKGASCHKNIYLNTNIFIGYGLLISVMFLSFMLMNYVPLKYFALIVSFNYPVTFLFAQFFLKESISPRAVVACICIIIGGFIFNL